jgi:ribosome-associated protein
MLHIGARRPAKDLQLTLFVVQFCKQLTIVWEHDRGCLRFNVSPVLSLKGHKRSGAKNFLWLLPVLRISMPNVDYIKLDQFLKHMQVVATGGQAKFLVQDGEVRVNDAVETRRGRKLVNGDCVEVLGQHFVVDLSSL